MTKVSSKRSSINGNHLFYKDPAVLFKGLKSEKVIKQLRAALIISDVVSYLQYAGAVIHAGSVIKEIMRCFKDLSEDQANKILIKMQRLNILKISKCFEVKLDDKYLPADDNKTVEEQLADFPSPSAMQSK